MPNENTDGTAVSNGELAGYKVVFGESASALDQSVAITDPAVTTYTFQNLPSGTWYFAIVAVDAEGDDSTPTNTISASL
ncbi:MAG: fibronectin type III domain-containing protein [Steroidobacteraceae bacterium]